MASSDEPELKKVKLVHYNFFKNHMFADNLKQQQMGQNSNMYSHHKKLEERIGGILCCTVCLDLPSTAIYQVN